MWSNKTEVCAPMASRRVLCSSRSYLEQTCLHMWNIRHRCHCSVMLKLLIVKYLQWGMEAKVVEWAAWDGLKIKRRRKVFNWMRKCTLFDVEGIRHNRRPEKHGEMVQEDTEWMDLTEEDRPGGDSPGWLDLTSGGEKSRRHPGLIQYTRRWVDSVEFSSSVMMMTWIDRRWSLCVCQEQCCDAGEWETEAAVVRSREGFV